MIEKFDDNKFKYDSFYNSEVTVDRFKFGHDVPILETELNEMQIINNKKIEDITRQLSYSGFIELVNKDFKYDEILYNPPNEMDIIQYNSIALAPCTILLNGKRYSLKGSFTYNGIEDYIHIPLGEAPSHGTREDLIYLEAWYQYVDAQKTLPKYGYQNGGSSGYIMVDPRVGDETSRRIALFWNIRIAYDVDFDKFPNGLGYDNISSYSKIKATADGNIRSDNMDYIFANASNMIFKDCEFFGDKNLWVAGRPNSPSGSSNIYNKYVFALPLFKLKRRNKTEYSINNFNGAYSYEKVSTGSNNIESSLHGDLANNVRPDYYMYDYIVPEDLIDLRKTVYIGNIDYNYLRDTSIDQLFKSTLLTSDNEKTKRIQIGNVTPEYSSNLINMFIKFDKNIQSMVYNQIDPQYAITYREGIEKPIYEKSLNNYGILLNGNYHIDYQLYLNPDSKYIGTLDFYICPYWYGIENNQQTILKIKDGEHLPIIKLKKDSQFLIFEFYKNNNPDDAEYLSTIKVDLNNNLLLAKNIYHIRLSWSDMKTISTCFVYINGKLVGQEPFIKGELNPKYLQIGEIEDEIEKGLVIEDIVFYNRSFEQNVGDEVNKSFINKYWPNIPQDINKGDTTLLPSFNGISKNISDVAIIQENTINYGKIISNLLTLNVGQGNIIDENTKPIVTDLDGNLVEGNWDGLGTSEARFTLNQMSSSDEIEPTIESLYTIDPDLSNLRDPNFIRYENNELWNEYVKNNIKRIIPQNCEEKKYAICYDNSMDHTIKYYTISDQWKDENLLEEIESIPGYELSIVVSDLLTIPEKSIVVFCSHKPQEFPKPNTETPENYFVVEGNIEHVHFDQYLADNTIITIVNEDGNVDEMGELIENGEYTLFIKEKTELQEDTVFVIENNSKSIYEGTDREISIIKGLKIQLPEDITECEKLSAITIKTTKGKIYDEDNYINISSEVSPLHHYDSNLKEYIMHSDLNEFRHTCKTNIRIYDKLAVENAEYELYVTNIKSGQETITIKKYNEDGELIELDNGNDIPLGNNIRVIPGIEFDLESFPKFTYLNDAIKIITIPSTEPDIPGKAEISKTVNYDDNYSEVLKTYFDINNKFFNNFDTNRYLLQDAVYKLVITGNTTIKLIDLNTQNTLFEGEVENGMCDKIPGLPFAFSIAPPACSIGDSIRITTKKVIFEDFESEIEARIPYLHFDEFLKEQIKTSMRLNELSLVEDDSFLIRVDDKESELITVIRLSDKKVLYSGTTGSNLDVIPGMLFNLPTLNDSNDFGAIIVNTVQVERGLDVIVRYTVCLSNGNGGYDTPNEIIAAGLVNKDFSVKEISFNHVGNDKRHVKYLRPRRINGTVDEAYDYSDHIRTTNDGFARELIYHVNGNRTDTYLIDKYLYGYEVLGVIEAKNRDIISCKIIPNPDDNKKECLEIIFKESIMHGDIIQFTLALGGITFDYDVNTKTLMTNIYKTFEIEFEATGEQDMQYELNYLSLPNSKYDNVKSKGFGFIRSLYSMRIKSKDTGEYSNKHVAYVDNSLFIPNNFDDQENPRYELAEYKVVTSRPGGINVTEEEALNDTVLKIKFVGNAPKKGTKVKIPVLVSYQPLASDIVSLWYRHTPYQGVLSNKYLDLKIISDWKFFITTLSNGNRNENYDMFNNLVNKLPGGSIFAYELTGESINFEYLSNMFNKEDVDNKLIFPKEYIASNLYSNIFELNKDIKIKKTSVGFQDGLIELDNKMFKLYFPDCKNPIKKYIGACCLAVNSEGELVLLLMSNFDYNNASKENILIPTYGDVFKIKNNPTIKGLW